MLEPVVLMEVVMPIECANSMVLAAGALLCLRSF